MATAQAKIITGSRPYLWTRDEYYRMGEAGLFLDRRVELIEGQVIEMSPMYSPHATAISLLHEALREAFGRGWLIRLQQPLYVSETSEPEPDAAVVIGKARDYKHEHPKTAALIVEVADSTLAADRKRKASLYAKAGIADYWIVNLGERQLEMHRRPIMSETAVYGFDYGDKMIFKEGERVAPLAKPKAKIAVADLLP